MNCLAHSPLSQSLYYCWIKLNLDSYLNPFSHCNLTAEVVKM